MIDLAEDQVETARKKFNYTRQTMLKPKHPVSIIVIIYQNKYRVKIVNKVCYFIMNEKNRLPLN